MYSYEIFTEQYSKIIQANTIELAMMLFNEPNEIIAVINIEHTIYKEFFGINESKEN